MQNQKSTVSDLLAPLDVDTASGDIGRQQLGNSCKAVWTRPIKYEKGAPDLRIIHNRVLKLNNPVTLFRIGLRKAAGYHKCGSHEDLDWITAFRVLIWTGTAWEVILYEKSIPEPQENQVLWYDLGEISALSVIIEARRCGIDEWWTGWNITSNAFILEGAISERDIPRKENRHVIKQIDIHSLPEGLHAEILDGEVRYKTRFLEVGFCLGKSGFSYFSIDETGNARTEQNLLRYQPGMNLQGIRLHPVGGDAESALFLRYAVKGTTTIQGNSVTYKMRMEQAGQEYTLTWTILEDRLLLRAERNGDSDLAAWESSLWNLSLSSQVSPACVLGSLSKTGETGLVKLPAYLHIPRFGNILMQATGKNMLLRSDSYRSFFMTSIELKLGETPQPEGGYLLQTGKHQAKMEFVVQSHHISLKRDTPREIEQALNRCTLTSMTYRPDTATLSNNGNSIHCPLCMDNWSGLAKRIGSILPHLDAMDLVKESLQRWLDGGPGYASGRMPDENGFHLAEDEYIMTGTAALLGLAEFLEYNGTREWLDSYESGIKHQLNLMRDRDVDGDGLVESTYRQGISGEHHWSTSWFDVISFGWKDAFSNALLYRALNGLTKQLTRLGKPDLAKALPEWAQKVKSNYYPTFFNPQTGWLAGWRCKENKLHDHGFLFVNGAAVNAGLLEDNIALDIMERLWEEAQRVVLPDFRLGLPGNLWNIPDEDMTGIMQGVSMGYYANGGLTHSQSRHFVEALYKTGMTEEADQILTGLCKSLGEGTAFGGINSGVDWRFWDGWPCGYEGLLTDQFGILMVAMDRYKAH